MSRLDLQADGLRRATQRRPAAPWLAVAGAKGGVGKTLLAVNLGLLFARAGYRALLVDLDPGCGNVAVHLRLQSLFSIDDVAAGLCTAQQAVVEGPLGLAVLAGRSGSEALAGGDPDARERALRAVADAAADRDVVICDTGAGIGPATIAVLERADLVLSTTTCEPSALTDAYALAKVLHLRGRPLPQLCVNQVRSRDDAMRTAGKLDTVCKRFLGAGAPLLGFVRRDTLLELSVSEQRPFALTGQGPALEDLRALCAGVLSALPPMPRRAARTPRVLQH